MIDRLAFDLIDIENGEKTKQRKSFSLLFAVLVGLRFLLDLPIEDDLSAPMTGIDIGWPLSNVRPERCPLLISPPPAALKSPTPR